MAQQPYGGYPMQQPYMAPQGYAPPSPYGYNPYGYNQTPYPGQPGQLDPSAQMFGMPNYDREEEED